MRENAAPRTETRDDLYRREPFDYRPWRNFYELLGGTIAVAFLVGIGVVIFASDAPGYWQNIYITGVGAFLTVAILDRQAEHRATRQRKEELILQMGNPDNGFAVEAARVLRLKGWLKDGSLTQVDLWQANLQKAQLNRSDLRNAQLAFANLQDVCLDAANLCSADLRCAKLQRARLWVADLRGACLELANLEKAQLISAELRLFQENNAPF
ncbi:MAG: pentapeptide repeat-containing protein [Anaerolineae bacterium]|nr:pentapeptide repeat-containing protein [Anaerolineae bacterium]